MGLSQKVSQEVKILENAQKFFKLKGKGVNVWGIPAFPKQDSEFDQEEKDATPF